MYNYTIPKTEEPSIQDGDIREITIPVKALFEWSDEIVTDWDEDSNPLEYKSGWIMSILSGKKVYNNEETKLIANTNLQDDNY